MDKESHNNHVNSNNIPSVRDKDKSGGSDGSGSLLLRASSDGIRQSTTPDLVLQWGNRKRLRCMKVQVKHDSSNPVQRTTVRVDRRVVRTEKDSSNRPIPPVTNYNNNNIHNNINQSNGYLNLRQRPPSPQQPPPRILRSSRTSHPNQRGAHVTVSWAVLGSKSDKSKPSCRSKSKLVFATKNLFFVVGFMIYDILWCCFVCKLILYSTLSTSGIRRLQLL
ncbi:uncharacterized protein LOC113846916 isoform X6 [Abrus precatorius]|uniref:Uncharacterized protein LOC113846916 isoform X6 n=1 Tax=Abrus precatorius TaxID=3816 RepID=A0A8B8JJ32_ABRPR|nr:uncharacterized protein LOC113846916 isoform X6 [Abrus precatorius]